MQLSEVDLRTTRRTCSRCVMDTTDPDITFDPAGICNHCHFYDENVRRLVRTGPEAQAELDILVARIKKDGAGRDYDCVIGVSGGVDSTYAAFRIKNLGLRPLAVHLDNGWNSELAVKNIELVLKKLDIDLSTHVMDWNEFRDLQLAFLKASTPDSEIPSDHAIVSLMFETARKIGVRWILSGVNAKTESHLPKAWSQGHNDWKYIRSIHERFGSGRLTTFPHRGFVRLIRDRWSLKWVDILNLMDYSKTEALKVLEKDLGWRYYGGKHYESIYTRFYQGCILPKKFGFDKRKCHLSSLVCSGEISRDEALKKLEEPTYPSELQAEDREYVVKKLQITPEEFDRIMALPPMRFEDYPSLSRNFLFRTLRAIHRKTK